MTDKQEVALWSPPKFEGTDLLPVDLGAQQIDTIGRDNIKAEDMILPSLRLLQGISEEVMLQDDPQMKAGRLLHTGNMDCFDGPIRVLLCEHHRSRALFPDQKKPEFAGIEQCISRDGEFGDKYGECQHCHHKEWGENRRPPLCSEAHNFVALTSYGPAVLRFARTSFTAARSFVTTWRMSPKPLWAHPAKISVKRDSREIGGKPTIFFRLELKWLMQESVPPAVQAAARAFHEQIVSAKTDGRFSAEDDHGFEDAQV